MTRPKGSKNLKTKVKEAKKITKAEIKAKLEEFYKAKDKFTLVNIKNYLAQTLKNIDPIEAAAIIGATFLVKYAIDTSEEIRGAIKVTTGLNELDLLLQIVSPGWGVSKILWSFLSGQIKDKSQEEIQQYAEEYEGMFPDFIDWLIAFGVAFIVVRHGDTIFKQFTSIGGFVTGLIK